MLPLGAPYTLAKPSSMYFGSLRVTFSTCNPTWDRSAPYFVLLSDLAKAFERVNPHWILHVLQRLGAPAWAHQYATYVLFGRSVRHRVGRFYRPPLPVRQGVDMGRAVSVLLCVAMDPVYVNLNTVPVSKGIWMRMLPVEGVQWLSEAQRAFTSACHAGFRAPLY